MSLINDALKRAKHAQQKHAPPAAAAAPMRPVETKRPARAPRSLLLPFLIAAVLVLVGGVLIVVAVSRGVRPRSTPDSDTVAANPSAPAVQGVSGSSTVTPQPVNSSSASPVPSVAPVVQPAQVTPATTAPPVTTVTQTVVVVEPAAPVAVVPAPPVPQLPKLQGILFNPAKPTAFLNGKSYVVGGRVGEYTVLAITKQAVTVERAGQTNVLTMEE